VSSKIYGATKFFLLSDVVGAILICKYIWMKGLRLHSYVTGAWQANCIVMWQVPGKLIYILYIDQGKSICKNFFCYNNAFKFYTVLLVQSGWYISDAFIVWHSSRVTEFESWLVYQLFCLMNFTTFLCTSRHIFRQYLEICFCHFLPNPWLLMYNDYVYAFILHNLLQLKQCSGNCDSDTIKLHERACHATLCHITAILRNVSFPLFLWSSCWALRFNMKIHFFQ
jgi:hypothetical protein